MTFEELLNAEMDFNSIAALARQGFDWWIDELASMAPAAWRASLASGPRIWAEPDADGVWRFWRDGRPLARPPQGSDARIGILLPARSVLVREIPTPRMPAADVRRMVALDIDRLSPLSPSLIHFDLEILDRETPAGQDANGQGALGPSAAGPRDGGQRVAVGIVPRTVAADLWARARAQGIEPAAMAARTDAAGAGRRFDFLPAVRAAAGEAPGGRAARWWWAGVGALLAANLAVLVGRDILSTRRLADLVEAQRPAVTAVQALRRRVEAEDKRRTDLVARARAAEPLRMLSVLTQALPANTWVQRLEWNGQTLHIVGARGRGTDVAAALRGSGLFTNPRAATNEASDSAAESRPYDITADVRTDAPRLDVGRGGGRP